MLIIAKPRYGNKIEWSCSWSMHYLLGNHMNYNHTPYGNLWHKPCIKILDLSFTLWIDISIKMNVILYLSHHEIYKPYDKYQAIRWLLVPQEKYFNNILDFKPNATRFVILVHKSEKITNSWIGDNIQKEGKPFFVHLFISLNR